MRDSLDSAADCSDSADSSLARPAAPARLDDNELPLTSASQKAPEHTLWPERFAARCRQLEDHPAIVDTVDGSQLTYGELAARVEGRREALRAAGVGPEVAVAVLLPRCVERIVTILATVAAGGAYIPLDPAYPAQRWRLMLEDTEAPLLITEASLATDETVPGGCRRWTLDQLDALPAEAQGPPSVLPQATAYIIYTSGSTGRPRGVAIEHRALAWYTAACVDHYQLTSDDRLPQLASIGFDISVGEIFPCLAAGGTLLLPPDEPMAAAGLLEWCRRWRSTVLFPATALWHEMARHLARHPRDLPTSLRLISFGGEKVSDKLLATWLDGLGDRVRLVNGYGPTEATVEATLHDLTTALTETDPRSTDAALIGRPVQNVQCRVLDEGLYPVPAQGVGELCLRSPGLARGYLNDAATTAVKFVPNPDSPVPGDRLYRTGDLVRRRPDQRLEILGRGDQQVKIRGYRIEPGEIEAHLQEHPDVAEAQVVATGIDEADLRLVAFVVRQTEARRPGAVEPASQTSASGILGVGGGAGGDDGDGTPPERLIKELRRFLHRRLPPHHVPSHLNLLPRLPLNDRQKVDRFQLVRLAEDGLRRQRAKAVGEHPIERRLAAIWQDILQLADFTVDDDFFALGGDSILAIRAVARAHDDGLPLTPKEIFEHRTLRRLGRLLARKAIERVTVTAPTVTAPRQAPLTPVQCWFFDEARLSNPHHFNQSMLLRVIDLDVDRLRRSITGLLEHHEALRLSFSRRGDRWLQQVRGLQDEDYLRVVDLRHSDLDAESLSHSRPETWRRWMTGVQSSLDLRNGPLVRFALFDFGPQRSSRLLIAIHHLVVDGVTWSILLQDLERLYAHLTSTSTTGGHDTALGSSAPTSPASLPPVGTSYLLWAQQQEAFAQSDELAAELPFWCDQGTGATPLALDFPDAHRRLDNTLASSVTVSFHLTRQRTEQLLRHLPAAYRTRINDVLLCAVAMAMGDPRTKLSDGCWIDVEGHGREELSPTMDLSRTAGWFTSTFPVALRLADPGDSREAAPGVFLKAIKEQLRRIPRHGVGFGWLFYLSQRQEVRDALADSPRPDISFNYLGQLDALFRHSRLFAPAEEPRGAEKCAHGLRPYALEIDGGVVAGRLWVNWHFSRNLHRRDTIEALADRCRRALLQLIDHCLLPTSGGLTPSDVPLAHLDQATLDPIVAGRRDIEDIFPLAPMQEGMLFHHQLASHSTAYFEQSSWTLKGPLRADALRRAWQHLVNLHPALRTFFVWQGLSRPLQVVQRHILLPFEEHDLRALPPDEQGRRVDDLITQDRRRGFDLRTPPLSRIMLLRLSDERSRFVWSYHHALLDGWSIARLFADAFQHYARGNAATVQRVTPFRDYIAWLEHTESHRGPQSRAFWQGYLAGYQGNARLTGGPLETAGPNLSALPRETPERTTGQPTAAPRNTLRRALSLKATTALERRARTSASTLAVWVQGAWAILLARHCNLQDVVFGSSVSCRPADLPGVEHIVGLMINTLPVRCRFEPRAPVLEWFQALQENLVEVRQHQHHSLAEIQGYSRHGGDLQRPDERSPGAASLFDHVMVFENYPTQVAMEAVQGYGELEVCDFQGFDETNYPWTLGILPGAPLRLDVNYDPALINPLQAQRLLARFDRVLRALALETPKTLGDIPFLTAAEHHQILTEWGQGSPFPTPTGHTADTPTTFLHRFMDRVVEAPDSPAIVSPGEHLQLTYRQLLTAALAVADLLRRDVGKTSTGSLDEEPIGVLLDRRAERVVATLGILFAGGVYVPLDITYPRPHLDRSCRVVGLARVISHPSLARAVLGQPVATDDGSTLRILDLGNLPTATDPTADPRRWPSPVEPEQLAYLLFTSGSTGEPKGVAIEHRSLDWYCQVAQEHYAIAPGDRVLHLAPVGFDFSICEIFPALAAGATLVVAEADTGSSANRLFNFSRRHRVSVLFPPTALWHQLVDEVVANPALLPSRLRLLASGGERILPQKLERWQRAVGETVRLMSGYGPTEITVEASLTCLSESTFWKDRTVDRAGRHRTSTADRSPLGRPLPGVEVRILDDHGDSRGIAQGGHLFLGGPGLARGYVNRPALTAASFLPDPFAEEPGQRLYRTGDVGRFENNGELSFEGRRDLQLKIRGHRVEPGTVEAALVALDGIAAAAVVGHRDNSGGGWLEAFVVAHGSVTPRQRAELRQRLADSLPSHLIPSSIHWLDRLPLTPGGKVDRRGLRSRTTARPAEPAAEGRRVTLTATEARLAGLWRDILNVEAVDPHSNFFALGGHSLLATRLLQRMRQVFARDIPLRDLFVYPTLGEMARRLTDDGPEGPRPVGQDPMGDDNP